MRVVIIGGTGHVGTYLVPRLVEAGHEVVALDRGQRQPYQPHAAWAAVERIVVDREEEDKQGTFGKRIRDLRPDVVIDMICFTPESARELVGALQGRVQHFLHCGTIWVHGHGLEVPITEEQPRRPFGEYGIHKAEIELYLLDQARRHGFPAAILHLGHIVGPGWMPLNPTGHFNPYVFSQLAKGEPVTLPNLGMETVHHVHADDVAQAFMAVLKNRSVSLGESFHITSPTAITLRGYAEAVAGWFGKEANLRYLGWETWRTQVTEAEAKATWDHIAHSPCVSIAKARRLLDYQPRYTSLQAVKESLAWLIHQGVVEAPPLT
jgi:nucleoside-diphosphate-sugar epimerase